MSFHLGDLAEALVRSTGLGAAALLIATLVLGEVEMLGRRRGAHLSHRTRAGRQTVVYVALTLLTLAGALLVLDIL